MALRVRDKDRKALASGTASPSVHTMKITSSKSGKCSRMITWGRVIRCNIATTRPSAPATEITTLGDTTAPPEEEVDGGSTLVIVVVEIA